MTVRGFFKELDKSGDGVVAGYELRRGLVRMELLTEVEAALVSWPSSSAVQVAQGGWLQVCHYMDPNADDAIEFHEFELALKRATQPVAAVEAEAQAACSD